MKDLFNETKKLNSLRRSWYRIRSNGLKSPLRETRYAIERFDRDAERHIRNIQKQLRDEEFFFDPQKGILKVKGSGSKRGIVMATVRNRVVERSLLNTLQQLVPFVRNVINTRTSVGGVPDRSVPHGLAIIRDAINNKKSYFIRSDITGFFDNIPRDEVLKILSEHTSDKRFIKLLTDATTVTLANEDALGEDRKAFPTYEDGVAQGSPLSPLFGNILLHDFDIQFNGKGIECVRFIDDFVLLGERQANVKKAFKHAKEHLGQHGLKCHDPFSKDTLKTKAQAGQAEAGFVFLGYEIRQDKLQPSEDARASLLNKIDNHIKRGRAAILDVLRAENSFKHRQRYIQTLDLLDRVVRGWGDAFAYSNVSESFDELDKQVEHKIRDFRKWYQRTIEHAGWQNKRRTGGVCLLGDIEAKSLDELPFKFEKPKTYRTTKDMITISTDGSVLGTGPMQGRKKGPGGWAAIFHNDTKEFCGYAPQVTNNQMELTAVIEALKHTPIGSRVKIRTDSMYVCRIVQEESLVKSNKTLWEEFEPLFKQRRVDMEWVEGHSGDPHNERADTLAKAQATLAQKKRAKP